MNTDIFEYHNVWTLHGYLDNYLYIFSQHYCIHADNIETGL